MRAEEREERKEREREKKRSENDRKIVMAHAQENGQRACSLCSCGDK